MNSWEELEEWLDEAIPSPAKAFLERKYGDLIPDNTNEWREFISRLEGVLITCHLNGLSPKEAMIFADKKFFPLYDKIFQPQLLNRSTDK